MTKQQRQHSITIGIPQSSVEPGTDRKITQHGIVEGTGLNNLDDIGVATMNDLSMQNPARFFADEKAARLREDLLEAACEREAFEYFDSCERGDCDEWSIYDQDESCDALLAIDRISRMKEEPIERLALIKEVLRGVMRNAANCHGGQVIANQSRPLPARWGAK